MADPVNIRAAVVTASDSRTLTDDVSGLRLTELLNSSGALVIEHIVVSDDLEDLRQTLHSLTEREDIDLILTTGGTGLGPRDNTPEATRTVIDREVPGIPEAMRRETAVKSGTSMLSRGIAGTRNRTLIINLPGSPKGVEECFAVIVPVLQHAVQITVGNTSHKG